MIRRIPKHHPPYVYKPKPQKMPECLVKRLTRKITSDDYLLQYRMVDVKTGKYVGQMLAYPTTVIPPSEYYPSMTAYDSFKISDLYVFDRGKGYGKKFIQLAKAESKRLGCNGRVHLTASSIHDPNNPPHVFYRKQKFTSQDKKSIAYMDKCIKKNEIGYWSLFDNVEMYLPLTHEIGYIPKSEIYLRYLKMKLHSLIKHK